jgi:hypothetical protein
MRFRVPSVALVLTGCVFFSVSLSRAGEVSGPYANRLSKADLEHIKSVVSKERAVNHTLKKIEAVAADKVHVQSGGRIAVDQDKYYEFDVYKRGGGWAIDMNSIQISIEQRDLRTNGPAVVR